jgi:hypothetical protein
MKKRSVSTMTKAPKNYAAIRAGTRSQKAERRFIERHGQTLKGWISDHLVCITE